MAPKKKGNKKAQQDDWEAELGETVDPIAQAEEEAKAQDAAEDAGEEAAAPSGLMAALRARKNKKGKKGKQQNDDWEAELGEDPTAAADEDGTSTPPVDLAAKAPEEGTMDDEDLYPEPAKKGKGGKGGKQQPEPAQDDNDDDDDEEKDSSGRVMTKKEKEKAKKEREKQRKKENVSRVLPC